MLCTTCNLQLRYDERLNALYCVDCEYMLFLPPKRNPVKLGRTAKVRRPHKLAALRA